MMMMVMVMVMVNGLKWAEQVIMCYYFLLDVIYQPCRNFSDS